MEKNSAPQNLLGAHESQFLSERDSFYLASIGSTGWPYIQHRGGPQGFLKVLDERTIAFADFRGNKQYITTGNLLTDDRVALILVDYPRQTRLKILGRAEILEGDAAANLIDQVRMPEYQAVIERIFRIRIEAFDWNCPQHITPRFTADEIRNALGPMENRVHALEEENQNLRQQLARLSGEQPRA